MKFTEEDKKRYSCGPLIKKKDCKGRTIIVMSLDASEAEGFNKRVAASQKGSFTGQHIPEEGGPIFGGRTKTLKR